LKSLKVICVECTTVYIRCLTPEQSLCICTCSKRAVNARICYRLICVLSAHRIVALGASVFTFHVNFTKTRLASTTFFAEFVADRLGAGCTPINSKSLATEQKADEKLMDLQHAVQSLVPSSCQQLPPGKYDVCRDVLIVCDLSNLGSSKSTLQMRSERLHQ